MAMEVPFWRRCQPRVLYGILIVMLVGLLAGRYLSKVGNLHHLKELSVGVFQKASGIMSTNISVNDVLNVKQKFEPQQIPISRSKHRKHFRSKLRSKMRSMMRLKSKPSKLDHKLKSKQSPPKASSDKIIQPNHDCPRALSFWDQFRLWDSYKRPAFGPDVPEDTDKYLIYRCDNTLPCGGWADRIKGILIGYLLANLTGRAFKAQIYAPHCELSHYLTPNRINWTYPIEELPQDNKTYWKYQYVDNKWFKHTMYERDFSTAFDRRLKYVYFSANLENVSGLLLNKLYKLQLAWAEDLTPADVYAAVYKRLFQLHPRLQDRIDKILFKTLKNPKHRLICIHLRMGNSKYFYDTEKRNNLTNLPKIWEFINMQSNSDYDKVFVMSDSKQVIKSAQNQLFSDRLVTIPGLIVHVALQAYMTTDQMCQGFEKLLLEHHMLMNCDVLVRGHSGLSVIASAIRGTDKDLYCLLRDGNIVPCVRNNFTTFI